ncbi:glycosyltransferase family 2 protein [Apibacter sp. B2966]|uniref:glycosyltransferase family 2 protein n=1 Tax=Apibacter sp. B2966 TaxID=2656761 RepID=UPI00140E37CE|nr:glycosyltransferase family 2 protein [Apibacter sp. B2966]QII72211.1 glycosyltransferase family 2 protein [Apibacter sp. B2966]
MEYKIIIVNYNGCSDTIECLESLLKSTIQNFQLFIVDNSLKFDDFEMFKKWGQNISMKIETKFPELVFPISEKSSQDLLYLNEEELYELKDIEQKIVFIKAKENKGFSAANNIVLKYLKKQDKFDYIWLLNNDTVVPVDFLHNISEKFKTMQNTIGIIGNSLCYYNQPEILQCTANKYNDWLAHTFPLYECMNYSDIPKKAIYNLIPIGASMFIKKECFMEVGFLEEDYFLYFEEWDYTSRAKKKDWKSIIFTDLYIFHKHGTTIDNGNNEGKSKTLFSDYYLLINKLVFAKKNLKWYHLPSVYLSFVPILINRIRRGQWDRIMMIFKIILGLKYNVK